MSRRAGLLLPLFSAASSRSWGVGELADLAPFAEWLAAAGFTRLMILPIGTMANGDSSPYSAVSAMAIDPIYIAMDDVPDFVRAGGVDALTPDSRAALEEARASSTVRYDRIRFAKTEAADRAFAQFLSDEWEQLTTRAAAFAAYIGRERWWLDDYALYQAVVRATGAADWRTWPERLRARDAGAIDEARRQLGRDVLRQQYLQWIAETQWQEARAAARAHGVSVIGDLPFVVGHMSADVWARQHEFWLDVSAGAPPDAFTDEGQDWKLPTYDWQTIARTDYDWLRQRSRRMAALYDGFRVDHLVGFFRTYGKPPVGKPFFNPGDEASQIHQGERILTIFQQSGAAVLAEDLGTVPDYVRATMARLDVPGHKVLRWERRWREPGRPFIDPAAYPTVSVALTGTHDTEPIAMWWDEAEVAERIAFAAQPAVQARGGVDPAQPFNDRIRDLVLDLAYASASDDAFVTMPDLFGWRDRINTPGTVNDINWTWRLPWPVDRLMQVTDFVDRARVSYALAVASGRL